jgi:hypothetical protein
VAEMLGLYLPEGLDYDDLDELEPEAQPEPPVTAVTAQVDSQDSQDAPGQRNEQQRDEEVKRLQRWLKKRPNRDPVGFASAILTEAERYAIAAQLKATPESEAQGSETPAPFRAESWEAYP